MYSFDIQRVTFYRVVGWWLGVSIAMGVCLRAGKPSRYVTICLGQLSLSSLRGR